MSLWDALSHRCRVAFNRRRYDREIATARAFHLEMEARMQLHASQQALTPHDALAAARRRFGNATLHHEETRHMAGLRFFETLSTDLRFATRGFRRSPTFTIVAVLTLAIGIGANTAIFSAFDALLLRPLPFAEPERLMKVSLTRPPRGEMPGSDDGVWSWPKFTVFREAQTVFSDLSLFTAYELTLRTRDAAERVMVEQTDSQYFTTLGVKPALGRLFVAEEDSVPGGVKAALLSQALFVRRFNADSAMIGKPIQIGADQYVVVGVMPPGFRGLGGKAELWVPALAFDPDLDKQPWSHGFVGVARLAKGVSPDAAKAATKQLGALVDRTYPDPASKALGDGAVARELDSVRIDPAVRRSLLLLFVAVGLVLCIACANVANLFLVRAIGRRHEIAVRLAIGATRRRLIRQLVTESLLLATLGGAFGVALAWAATRFLATIDPTRALHLKRGSDVGVIGFDGIGIDPTALLVATALTLGTGLLFGVIPALQATRPNVFGDLRKGRARGMGVGRSSRSVLVAVEIAMAVVLLVGAGLMTRSLGRMIGIAPGIRVDGVLTMRFNAQEGARRDSMPGYYDRIMQRLSAVSSVTEVAVQDCPPLNGGCNGTTMWRNDRPHGTPGTDPLVGVHWISPNWPAVMDVRLLDGRLFDGGDRLGRRKVALISASAAKRLWPGESPLGKPMGVGQGGFDSAYVVGVIDDVRYGTLDSLPGADVYLPHAQSPRFRNMLFLRTSATPDAVVPAIRAALREVEPSQPLYDVRTMHSRVADSTAYQRFATTILVLFAATALLLAIIGVYGTISFSVSQRTREIGIRMALGAQQRGVTRMIVREGLTVAACGAAAGLVIAFAVTGLLRSMLYEVRPTDPVTYAAIVALLMLSVAVACWLPARRASRIAPTVALREE